MENAPVEKKRENTPELIGASKHIKILKSQIKTAASKDSTVLIQGDSGTGQRIGSPTYS